MECGCGVRKFSQMWVSRHTAVTIGSLSVFFAQSVRIKLALPQTAQLSIYILKENQQCCTSVRDLIEYAPLIDKGSTEKEREDKKAQHPAGFKPKTSLS